MQGAHSSLQNCLRPNEASSHAQISVPVYSLYLFEVMIKNITAIRCVKAVYPQAFQIRRQALVDIQASGLRTANRLTCGPADLGSSS